MSATTPNSLSFSESRKRCSASLAPPSDPQSLFNRWDHTIKKIDEDLSKIRNSDACQRNIVQLRRPPDNDASSPSALLQNDSYFSVLHAPGTQADRTRLSRLGAPYVLTKSFREWVQQQKAAFNTSDATKRKQFFERCVGIIHSLVLKIVVTSVEGGKAKMEVAVDPKFIATDNLMVQRTHNKEGDTFHFQRTADDGASDIHSSNTDNTNNYEEKKYAAMKALGMVAYEVLMRGVGPPIQSFLPMTMITSEGTTRLLLSLDDYDEKPRQLGGSQEQEQAKRLRATANKGDRISSAMITAGVPYPLCRLVVDLLGGECIDGLLFRSDSSFESFSDVIEDLNQMREDPEAFVHLSVKDQWRLAFGETMHGRKSELEILMEVASRVSGFKSNDALFEALAMFKSKKQQIAYVTGQAGVGKTRLVMETKKALENQGWLFLSCKFEKIIHSEPLSVVASAFDDFLQHCLGNLRHVQIRAHLDKLLQPKEIAVLVKHVPSLIKYAEHHRIKPAHDFEVNTGQMHYFFSQLLQALSASGNPIALFFDDIHWIDAASLDLLLALTKSSRESNLSAENSVKSKKPKVLFIGSYRENEVKDNPQLVEMMDELENTKSVEVTTVAVGGFDRDSLNKIVSKSLCLPLRRTRPLSETILHKTDGIVIHIIELIERLTMENILCHSLIKGWEWDSEVIESCPISDSVAELFSFKLRTLSEDALIALQVCSIIGTQIDKRIIGFLQDYDGDHNVDMNAALKDASVLGLIETAGSPTVYKFAHDIISQAAFDLIPQGERSQLLQKLAAALIKNATAANKIDLVIFLAADLINRIKNCTEKDLNQRVHYATMNLKAGKKALTIPDFHCAVRYTESAISLLDSGHWKTQRKLMLSIYQTSVAALYSCSGSDQAVLNERINVVLNHASDLDEEFDTRFVWIKLLSVTSSQSAIDECHKLLERLGEPIDSSNISPSSTVAEIVRVKDFLLKKVQYVTKLPQMSDGNKLKAMKVLAPLTQFYHLKRNFNCITITRMVEMSMAYGCCGESPFAFATFSAAVTCMLNDIDSGCNFARMALQLSKSQPKLNGMLPGVLGVVYGFSLFWQEPLQSTVDPIVHGIRLGFAYGDIEFAVGNVLLYATRILYCGTKKINSLLGEIELLALKIADCGRIRNVQYYLTPIYNSLCELKGLEPKVLPPLDKFICNDELLDLTLAESNELDHEMLLKNEITTAVILREMEKAQRISVIVKERVSRDRLEFPRIVFDFFSAITDCYHARHGDHTTHITEAKDIRDRLEKLMDQSRWNFENKYLLIKAECHYTEGEVDKAAESYKASVTAAKNHKFVHEEALGCELAGYFFKEQGDETKAQEMFKQAQIAYAKWGANAKTFPGV